MKRKLAINESELSRLSDQNSNLFYKNIKLENDLYEKTEAESHLKKRVEALEAELREKDKRIEAKDSTISQLQEALINQSLSLKEKYLEIQGFFQHIVSNMKLLDQYMLNGSQRAYTTVTEINSNLNILNKNSERIVKTIQFPDASIFKIPTTHNELLGLEGIYNSPETVNRAKRDLLTVVHPDKIRSNITWVKTLFTELTKTVTMCA